ncbi:hypothetical protein [Vibrio crassostreae]|uniref:hypothetical protein n=1 Tax=Vibrio crassostreae TaxID=246167 RepID=UPI001B307970|nr:hypothetical protein [Vibrio crassostreae]
MSKSKQGSVVVKKFGTAETISAVFGKPQLFQSLIEQSDLSGDTSHQMGFSQTKYELLLREFLSTHGASDVSRYKALYSLENLKQANLLIDWDRGNKRLTFCESFIELVRLSDERLIRELTDIEYRGMLEEMKRLRDKLRETGLASVDEEYYFDIRHAMFNHLRKIRTAIRTNEVKFNTISQKLAEISSGITHDEVAYGKAKREMYAKASKLYERHIKPTVEFLDKGAKVEGGNLFVVLNDIKEIFTKRLEHSHADELIFSSLNLSNSYKPIEKIANEVRKFLSITRGNARAFNAFEKVHRSINLALKEIKGSSMKSKTLMRNQELVEIFDFYKGAEGTGALKAQSGLLFADNPVFFKNMKLELEQLRALKGVIEAEQVVDAEVIQDEKKISKELSDQKRADLLTSIVRKMDLRETGDLYSLLHERLTATLPQYSFFDLNVAKRGIVKRADEEGLIVVPTGFRQEVEHNNKNYTYNVRRLKAKTC